MASNPFSLIIYTRAKCNFSVSSVKFLGHIVNKDGIKAYPDKTSPILNMKLLQNISELCRFMGLANQLGKFSCHLAYLSKSISKCSSFNSV